MAVLALVLGMEFKAQAFIHPGIPLTTNDLDDVKSNLGNFPWSQGYAALLGEGQASTNYVMAGPFGLVSRSPDINLSGWKSDMTAIWDLSRMWYFTKDNNYAQKAHDILLAYATTMTNFGGGEAPLALGDYSSAYGPGADILRGTWPGWTTADTLAVSNLFKTVYLPATFLGDTNVSTPGEANKGALYMVGALTCAVFCDDTNMFNHQLYLFRTTASCGVHNNSLTSGEMGETGRDQGHSYNYLLRMAFMAEVFYKQGIDIYGEDDNRLLADGEYYARNNIPPTATFVPFGTIDWYYLANASDGLYVSEPMMANILRSAYVVRKGLTAPWMVRKRYATPAKDGVYAAQVENSFSFTFLKSADASTAVAPPPIVYPTAQSVTSGFTDLDIGGSSPSGSSSYSNGVWTVTGGGTDIFTHNPDSCHFVYKALTGDCTMIAKVNVVQPTASNSRAGVMIRDSLSSSSAYRAFMTITPSKTGDSFLHGWSQNWGGRSNAQRPIPQTSYWVKLERLGDVINLYVSPDGTSWGVSVVGQYWNLPSTMYVGLVVCSEVAGASCTATFSNVSITGGDGGNVTVPAAPYYVYASPDAGQVPLRWLTSFGATSYSVYRSLTNGGPYTLRAAGVTNASYIDTGVAANTTYYYVVTATNSAGVSGYSTQESVTTQPAPAAPMNLTILPGNGSATLLWASSSGATSYNVKRSTTSGSGYVTVTNLTGTSWLDTGLANGTTYYYVVSAISAAGEGSNSPEVSVIPSASAAALLWSGAVNGTWDTSTANWVNNGGPATYQNGVPVIFDDSALSNSAVSLSATISPSVVIFNNSVKSYTINGNGIGGTCGVTLFGGGSVALNGSNTFTGGTTLNNGTIIFGNGSALGTGAVTANGGTLKWNYVSGNANVANNIVANGSVTFDTSSGNWTQNGPITGNGTITRGVSGTLSLYFAGDNSGFTGTYQDQNNGNAVTRFSSNTAGSASASWIFNQPVVGRTSIEFSGAGTISFGSLTGSGSIQSGNNNGTKTISVGALGLNDVFSGVIADGSAIVALTKVGTGTMTLSGVNTYTGPNNINAGKLIITTAAPAKGNYTVANGATLSVTNVTTTAASISNLTLAAGSSLELMNIASTTTPLLAANNVTVNGSCTVKILLSDGIALGTYPLMSYAGNFSGNFANLQLQLPAGLSGTLVSNANQIALSITVIPVPAAPTDLGATSRGTQIELDWSAIDFAAGYNIWRSLTSGSGYALVGNTTNTTFMDSGLAVNQTYYYVLTATNSFGSSAYSPEANATTQPALKWTGAASVNWDKATTNWSVTGLPTAYQDGASVWFDDTALSNVAINVTATMSPAITVVSNSSKSYSFSGNDISGTGSLLKLGNGTVTFNVANTYSGGTTLSNGMIVVGNGDALGTGTITANSGTLKWNYTSGNGAMANTVVVNGPVTFDTSAGNWTITGPITGSGTITRGTSGVLSLYLGGDNSGFTGIYQDQNNANSITRFTANTAGSASARWKFNQPSLGRTSLPTTSGTIRFGSFSGTGTLSDGGSGIVNIIEVGALGLNDIFSGVIGTFSGKIGLTKVGTGTMSLLGANTYTGTNNITAGKLLISTASLANGVYLVASNATFAVTNTTTSSATISNLIVVAGSALEFQRVTNPVTPLIAASNLIVNGSCLVKIIGTNGLKIGANYPLISYSGTLSGQLTNLLLQMPGGFSGTLVRNTNLLMLAVTSTNTPSGLTATPGNNQIILNWTPVIGATNYNVKRATTSGGPYTLITSSTAASYTDIMVTNGTTYYYVVSALSGSGESPTSVEVNATPQSPLQVYLKFDESSGTSAADATGDGWTGTLVNGPTWVAGYSNNAVNLSSGSSQYVTLPTGVVSNLTDFTISAWAKQTTTASWMRIFDFGSGTATYMFLTPLPGGATAPRFAFKLNNGAEQQINGTSAVSVGPWHHFAVTLNGSVGILYVDGVAVGTNSSMTLNPSSLGNTTTNYIGKSQYNDPYFNGQVDEFRIYRGALSAVEVATLVTPLAAPAGLAATAGDGQVALSWSAVAGAANYQVFRSLTSGGPYTQIATVTATNYLDAPLLDGTNYFYVVKAANTVGTSANSTEVSARPVSATRPTASFAVVGNKLQLNWPADHTGWRLQMNTNLSAANWQDVPGANATNQMTIQSTNANAFFRLVYP